jgi:hypothetical protein
MAEPDGGELVDYRLAQYTSTRLAESEPGLPTSFLAKVTHSGARPILILSSVEELGDLDAIPISGASFLSSQQFIPWLLKGRF